MAFTPGPAAALIRKLADALIACPIGQIITYYMLSAVLGADVQEKYWLLHRALDLASEEVGANFANIRQVGYHRMEGSELLGVPQRGRRRIRRISSRTTKHVTNTLVRANDVPDDIRLKAHAELATLSLMQYASYDRNVPKLPAGKKPPPTHETVRATVTALREAYQRSV